MPVSFARHACALAAACAVLLPAPAGWRAAAQAQAATPSISEWSAQQRRAKRPTRIEVYPSSRLYRQCVDWYALENRPSGPVITPHMRCWWAYR